MNFCIEVNTLNASDMGIDAVEVKNYLERNFKLLDMNEKQLKKKIVEIISTEEHVLNILDDLDMTYKYFIEIIFLTYSSIFTTSFINKYVKNTYQKFKNF